MMALSLAFGAKQRLIPREIFVPAHIRCQSQKVNAARWEAKHG